MGLVTDFFPATAFADLVKARSDDVRSAIDVLWQELYETEGASITKETALARDLSSALALLDPLTKLPTRCVILRTTSDDWVVVYYNVINGMSHAAALAKRLVTDVAHFRLMPNTVKRQGKTLVGRFGVVRFEYYVDGQERREIVTVNDQGKWRFGHNGDLLPFEDARRYRAPRAVDRFTPTLLLQYLATLGPRPFDDNFFRVDARHPAEGVRLTWDAKRYANIPAKSLDELRQEWGLDGEVITTFLHGESPTPVLPKGRKRRGR